MEKNSDKALNGATLELTQRIQVHFPRNIKPDILRVWNGLPRERLEDALREVFGKLPRINELLKQIGAIGMPQSDEKFVVSERFARNTGPNVPVKILSVDSNFKKWFWGMDSPFLKKEVIGFYDLQYDSLDAPIITELECKTAVDIAINFAELYILMKRHADGERLILFDKGEVKGNIFYVLDKQGILRSVNIQWDNKERGWEITAYTINNSRNWGAGCRVFSA